MRASPMQMHVNPRKLILMFGIWLVGVSLGAIIGYAIRVMLM
jgi:hypothetical protein